MQLAFIHTADWQLGKAFGAFDERKQTLLREARLTAIDRIAEAARARGASFVLVAGDVFDHPMPGDALVRQTLARLAKHAPLIWHLLPGNHDALRSGGVWDRLARTGAPANVIIHGRPEPYLLAPHAVLLPAPLTSAASSHDPTAWMDSAETPPGAVRIGLAHGSVRGFGSAQEASQLIAPTRAASARLDYLALGDWHGLQLISDRVAYAGTPEPDRYPDNLPGHVIAVEVQGPPGIERAPLTVESVRVWHYAWAEREVLVEQASDWERFAADLAEGGLSPASTPMDRQVVKVVLRGAVTLAERVAIETSIAALEPSFFHLEADLTGLMDRAADDDLAGLSDEGVRALAVRLQAMVAGPDAAAAGVARLALRKLVRLDTEIAVQARPSSSNGGASS